LEEKQLIGEKMRIAGFEITRIKNQETMLPAGQVHGKASGSVSIRYGSYSSNVPSNWDMSVYRAIRQAIPFVDMAVIQLSMMVGQFSVECESDADQKLSDEFLKKARVNFLSYGVSNWTKQMVDSTLHLGMGIGEINTTGDHLTNGIPENIRFIKEGEEYILGYQQPQTSQTVVVDPDKCFYSTFVQRDGNPFGYSIFYSCPFVSQMYTMLQESMYNTIWRFGDPSIVSIVMGDKDNPGDKNPEVLSGIIKTGLQDVYQARNQGKVKDMHLYSPGGYSIKFQALGADGKTQMFDFHFPSRFLIESIITVTLLPPYRFALYDWNSNYRMSTDQAEALKANIYSYRETMTNIADRLMYYFFMSRKRTGAKFKIVWPEIDWTDAKESAETRNLDAETLATIAETYISLWQNQLISDNDVYDSLITIGVLGEKTNKDVFIKNIAKYKKLILLSKVPEKIAGAKRLQQLKRYADES
jgi:hypothetical protein